MRRGFRGGHFEHADDGSIKIILSYRSERHRMVTAPPDWLGLVRALRAAVDPDPFWERRLAAVRDDGSALHLAILVEPYLTAILQGRKTIESRFTKHRVAPYGAIAVGDLLVLKRSSGPIVGLAVAAEIWSYELDPSIFRTLVEDFSAPLGVTEPAFWTQRQDARYATLVRLARVRAIPPLDFPKRDRRAWVVLKPGCSIG